MDARELLVDLYGRLPALARSAAEALDARQLCHQVAEGANPIGWLVWHAARVQDHHVSQLRGVDQAWEQGPWASELGLRDDPDDTGYGHRPDQVAAVRPPGPEPLLAYFDEVQGRTVRFLGTIDAAALDAVVDERWDPPVTMGVRLVSVADDTLQHLGQANYLRGLLRA